MDRNFECSDYTENGNEYCNSIKICEWDNESNGCGPSNEIQELKCSEDIEDEETCIKNGCGMFPVGKCNKIEEGNEGEGGKAGEEGKEGEGGEEGEKEKEGEKEVKVEEVDYSGFIKKSFLIYFIYYFIF
jgi:hypothetical protein